MHTLIQQGVTHCQSITVEVRRGCADEHIRPFLHHMTLCWREWGVTTQESIGNSDTLFEVDRMCAF
jgi:hypothetical protein